MQVEGFLFHFRLGMAGVYMMSREALNYCKTN